MLYAYNINIINRDECVWKKEDVIFRVPFMVEERNRVRFFDCASE